MKKQFFKLVPATEDEVVGHSFVLLLPPLTPVTTFVHQNHRIAPDFALNIMTGTAAVFNLKKLVDTHA